VTTHLENLEKSGNSKVVREKSGEVKSGVFFQAVNTPKLIFRPGLRPGPAGGAYNASPDFLASWGGGHPIPSPAVTTLFFTNVKQ